MRAVKWGRTQLSCACVSMQSRPNHPNYAQLGFRVPPDHIPQQSTAEMDWCRVVGPHGLCRPLDEKQVQQTTRPLALCAGCSKWNTSGWNAICSSGSRAGTKKGAEGRAGVGGQGQRGRGRGRGRGSGRGRGLGFRV